MPDETDEQVETMVRREVAAARPDELYLGRALLRLLDAERAKVADAWDEGRSALQRDLARSMSIWDAGPATPNPYRALADQPEQEAP